MAYAQVSYGSQGSDVKTLQEMLNKNGYDLKVDGIFGSKTQAAVRDYQSKNNLAVDGIVGNNTWGSLTSSKSSGSSDTETESGGTKTETTAAPSYTTPYEPSDAVKKAEAMLAEQLANKPGEYTSPWQSQLNDVIDKIMNREEFSYDLNGDALYQQYKDQYIKQGQMAMMDAMGQAAALTGGYGSSYGQAVGQQAYQSHLQELNDIVPDLYQMALDQYNQKGQDLYNQYSLLGTQEEQEYGRYRDSVSDYYTQLADLRDQYNAERDYDYSKYADARDFSYQSERDKAADEQWQKEFDEAVRQYNQSYALSSSGSSGGSSGGSSSSISSSSSSKTTYDTHGYTTAQIKALQKAAGITVDGIWGAQTEAAYKAGYRPDSTNTTAAKTAANATYNTGELVEAAAAGYSYSQIEALLKKRGVDTSSAAVKADIKWALSK